LKGCEATGHRGRAARPAEADREVGAGVVGEAGCAAMNARNVENRKQHVTFFKIKVAQVAQVALT